MPELLHIASSAGLGVLSLRRALNLGTSWCLTVCSHSRFRYQRHSPRFVPLFSHPHGICHYISTTASTRETKVRQLFILNFIKTYLLPSRRLNQYLPAEWC